MTTLNITASPRGNMAGTPNPAGKFGTIKEIMQGMAEVKRQAQRCSECLNQSCCLTHQSCAKVDMKNVDDHASVQRMRFTSAAMSGDIPAMRGLLKTLSSPDEPDPWGATPLTFAVMVGNRAGIEELLRMGADPLRRNRSGRSPLDNAMDAFPIMPDIIELLKRAAGAHFGRGAQE
jgi:hypothetical protein